MSLLAALRAAVAPAAPLVAQPPPGPHVDLAAVGPCPFTFGPWEAASAPQAAPGEAQRPVYAAGALVAWQRRVLQHWVPLQGEPAGEPVALFQLVTPDGRQCLAPLHPQALLEDLAFRLGL